MKLASPEGLVYCFLDEVHYFNEWQVFVKAHYEQKKTKFVVTGSNSRLLSTEFITLLSGRTTSVEVYPFSFGEFMQARGAGTSDPVTQIKHRHIIRQMMDDYLQFGGFPEAAFLKEPETIKEIHAMYGVIWCQILIFDYSTCGLHRSRPNLRDFLTLPSSLNPFRSALNPP